MDTRTQTVAPANDPRLIAAYSLVVGSARTLPALGFLMLAWVLTVEDYGRAAVLASIYAILVAVTDSGFDAAASIRLAAGDAPNAVLRASLRARFVAWLVGSVIGVVVLHLSLRAVNGLTASAFALICLGALVTSITSTLRVIDREDDPWLEARLLSTEKVLIGVLTAVLAWQTRSYVGYAVGTFVAPICLFGATTFRKRLREVLSAPPHHQKLLTASMTRTALPIGLSIYASLLYWRLDVLVISRLMGDEAAGAYAQGYYPIMAAAMLPGSGAVLLLRRAGKARLRLGRLIAIAAGSGGAVAALVWLFGVSALGYLELIDDPRAGSVLRVASLSLPFVFVNPLVAMFLRGVGMSWSVTALSVGGVAVNCTSVLLLVNAYGVTGAAWASLLTEASLTVFLLVPLRRHFVSLAAT